MYLVVAGMAENLVMGTRLRTSLCDLIGIDYPILSVGFGVAAGPELVAAVSNAGGFGVLGATGMSPDQIISRIARTRQLTNRPFGINFIIAESESDSDEDRAFLHEEVAASADERVAAIVPFWGDPAPYLEQAHRKGVKVFIQVGSVEEARAAAEAGVDAVIAQGVEAGGHVRGTTSVWELLPATIATVEPLPVIASGGIGDDAGIARALVLGAQGVSLGTPFVASEEAWLHPAYEQRIVTAPPKTLSSTSCTTSGGPALRIERFATRRLRNGIAPAGHRTASDRAKGRRSAGGTRFRD